MVVDYTVNKELNSTGFDVGFAYSYCQRCLSSNKYKKVLRYQQCCDYSLITAI